MFKQRARGMRNYSPGQQLVHYCVCFGLSGKVSFPGGWNENVLKAQEVLLGGMPWSAKEQ